MRDSEARRAQTKGLPERRNSPFVAAITRYLAAFDGWKTDPPMAERDQINHYIKETRSRWHKLHLAGR